MEDKIKIVEYCGARVLTTQQLAEAYETNTDTITKNFNRNKDRYVEGKHYVCLKGENLKDFRANGQIDLLPNIHTLYLWTEKGTFLHAKSLNTDKAWEVYDRLVEDYFQSRERKFAIQELPPEMQMFKQLWDMQANTFLEQKRQAEKIEKLESNQKALADTFSAQSDTEDFQAWANKCIARIAESPMFNKGVGRNSRYAYARNESYERLKKKWNCNLDDRVARAKGRAMERNPGITKSELNAINKLTVIANDKSLRPVYETVLKEMMIQYCVEVPR